MQIFFNFSGKFGRRKPRTILSNTDNPAIRHLKMFVRTTIALGSARPTDGAICIVASRNCFDRYISNNIFRFLPACGDVSLKSAFDNLVRFPCSFHDFVPRARWRPAGARSPLLFSPYNRRGRNRPKQFYARQH